MADKLRSFGVKVIIVDVPRPQLGVDAGCRAGRSVSVIAFERIQRAQAARVKPYLRLSGVFSARFNSSLFYAGNLALAAGSLLRGSSLYGVGIGDAEE